MFIRMSTALPVLAGVASLFLGLAWAIAPEAQAEPGLSASSAPAAKTLVFFGDSLTAGYGLDNAAAQAFPALIQQKLKAEGSDYIVINAGVSGDTSAGGLRRIDWLLRRPVDVFVLELGGNDGLRGLPPEETQRNLLGIIEKVRAKNPNVRVMVAGMMMPPNFGADYVARFAAVFPAVAKEAHAALLPFILQGVGGDPRLNQQDRIHPTAEGHRVIADLVWPLLKPLCT